MCRETHLEYRPKHTFFENVSYGNTEGGRLGNFFGDHGWKAFWYALASELVMLGLKERGVAGNMVLLHNCGCEMSQLGDCCILSASST